MTATNTPSTQSNKRPHSPTATTDVQEPHPKKGRYIPCIIKGRQGQGFQEGDSRVYLLSEDIQPSLPLTPSRLALNELYNELTRSTPRRLHFDPHGPLYPLQLSDLPPAEPKSAPYNGLRKQTQPFDAKLYGTYPPRPQAPEEIKELYISEYEMGPDPYWSQSETESYDGRFGWGASESDVEGEEGSEAEGVGEGEGGGEAAGGEGDDTVIHHEVAGGDSFEKTWEQVEKTVVEDKGVGKYGLKSMDVEEDGVVVMEP